jgi:hypothetical protein
MNVRKEKDKFYRGEIKKDETHLQTSIKESSVKAARWEASAQNQKKEGSYTDT